MNGTHLDLCSGIGGFALAARWHGLRTIGFCEIDPWCRRVLAKNFPGVPQHDDVTTLGGDHVRQWLTNANERLGHEGGTVANAATVQRPTVQRIESNRVADVGGTLSLLTAGYTYHLHHATHVMPDLEHVTSGARGSYGR